MFFSSGFLISGEFGYVGGALCTLHEIVKRSQNGTKLKLFYEDLALQAFQDCSKSITRTICINIFVFNYTTVIYLIPKMVFLI